MPIMIKASRIWIACGEKLGTWGHKCPSLWTCSPRSLGLPSNLLNAFLFPLTNHTQVFRGPIVSFLITLARVFQVQMLYSCASLLAISLGVTNLSCIRQIWVYVLFLRKETTNYTPLHFFPFCSIRILLLSPHLNTHTFRTFTVCFWDCSSAQFSSTLWHLLMQSKETGVRLCLISSCNGLTNRRVT